jgi:predicted  nucleic acid-binding Zn-ribbon protein
MAIDNVQLKDRASNKDKEEVNALQHRLYDLNNELRTARAQLEAASQELQRAEAEGKAAKSERSLLEAELQKRQKRLEGLETSCRSI